MISTDCIRLSRFAFVIFNVMLVSVASANVALAQQDLPSAEQLLDKYAEAMGGSAFQEIKSRKITGTFRADIAGHNINATIVYQDVAPNKRHLAFTGDVMSFVRVTNGEQVWEWRAASHGRDESTEFKSGQVADLFRMSACLAAPLKWRDLYKEVKTLGLEEVEERPAYKVQAKTQSGEELIMFFEKVNGRLVKQVRNLTSAAGEYPVEVLLLDYKKIDGVWMAMRRSETHHLPGFEPGQQVWQFDEVVHDVDVPEALFEVPEELSKSDKQ